MKMKITYFKKDINTVDKSLEVLLFTNYNTVNL